MIKRTLAATAAILAMLALTAASAPAQTPFSTPLLSLFDPTPGANDTFGYSLESTDHNLDGVPDLYVGSFDGSYVFLNNGALQQAFDLPPEDEATQPAGNTNLGRSVAAPGDLNNDGKPDYVAGSPGYDVYTGTGPVCGQPEPNGCNENEGRAYVYLSNAGASYDTIRLGSFAPQPGGRFADRMASAGDLNADGVNDVWIAAYSQDVGGLQNVGRIWAMSGATRTPLYAIDHPEPQNCVGFACGLGWTISNVGDIDGDRVNDVAAGANRQNVGGNASQGKAYVFSGRTGELLYGLDNPAPQANAYFGWASAAGDVVKADGTAGQDGISEILVGAFQNDFPAGCGEQTPIPVGCRKDQGQSFVFNGAPGVPAAQRLVRTLNVPAADRYLGPDGRCVSPNQQVTQQICGGAGIVNEGVGDIDRDGFWDQSVTAWTTGISRSTGEACYGNPTATPPITTDDCNERQGRIYLYSGRDGSLLRRIDNPVTGGENIAGTSPAQGQGALFGLQIVQAGAPGDINADGHADVYGIGFQQAGPARGETPPIPQEGRAWVFSGRAIAPPPPAPAPPAPAPPAPPAPPAAPAADAGPFTAKLSIARATINRRDRVLDVLAPITRLASGRANVELHAAGRRFRFTAPVNSRDGRIRFRQRIPKAQADLGTGIVTITYRGDADTRPQTVRLRAASQQAKLRLSRPTISNGRLRASGTVTNRARGVVRVQIQYVVRGNTSTLEFKARINDGRWSLNEQLSQTVRTAIAQRTGTVHSYTLFTGYYPRRVRGEMRSFQVLGPR